MNSPKPPTLHEFALLHVLRAEAERLPRLAAKIAVTYMSDIELPFTWRPVLKRTLNDRAADEECPPLHVLQAECGEWNDGPPAADHRDATDARRWLMGLQAHAAAYLPTAAPAS